MNLKKLTLIGYGCGLAAGDPGCADGPVKLQSEFNSLELLSPQPNHQDKYNVIAELSIRLAKRVEQSVLEKKPFIVFAGDHSCAIGTWSGAAHALLDHDIGLIWIDAHLDAHTPETSPSGNIHGMPVAHLMGYGNRSLTSILNSSPKIKPENICFIGIRSFEEGEQKLIEKLKIKVFYMKEVEERSLDIIFKEAKEHITKNTSYYGLSIDLDGIDPTETPGTGTPEPNGIHAQELCEALKRYCQGDAKLLGAEITEFNPHRDVEGKTRKVIHQLVNAIF